MRTLLLSAGAALLAACSPKAAPPAPAPRPVYVLSVPPAQASPGEGLPASVEARRQAELGFRSGGRVAERVVEPGQRVRTGQVLARLVDTEQRQGLAAAQAQLEAARLDAAQQARDAGRLGRLAPAGSIGAAEAERQLTGAQAAAQRQQAAQAQWQLAQERLAHTVLRAPFDGVVTQLRAEVGQVLAEGVPLLQLAQTEALELQVDLPPSLARQAATLTGQALDRRWRLRELQPAAHPLTRTQRARFQVQGEPLGWEPSLLGRSVTLQLQGTGTAPKHALPASALLGTGDALQVWRVVDGRLQALPVQVLAREGERVWVSGLPAQAQVVALGAHRLEAGQAVRALPLERAP